MCVCSDPTVTKGTDDLIVHQADLDFPVTTESAAVSRFLSKPFDGVRIVFSTYQSAQVVADGMPVGADGMAQPFDLAVFDEAHKTASRDGTRFSFALADTNLPIRKRLFFTATPRHYDIRKKDKEGDSTLVYSMDKPEIYGPVVHTLSFAEAARRGIICDYKVVISVVTSGMVNDHLLQHGKVIVDGDTVKARQVALQIALQKAVEKYGVSRIFTFHGSVAAARSFTSEDGEGIRNHLPDFTTLHVSGEMSTARREDHMKVFRQADKAVMSDARCLTEGVDVPAVDMVAFISPRKSKVDIVQATGRAMRKSDETGKQFGYVMVPLFVEQAANESIEEALQRTGFSDIWDLLGAMREQDDVLVDIIRQMQEDKGRTGGYDESRFNERVEVLGPSVPLDMIRGAITAECLESLGASWDERFGELLAYSEKMGNPNPPSIFRTANDFCLGQWAAVQRRLRDQLSVDRRSRLDKLSGWMWDIRDEKWESGFVRLKEFCEREGHAKVPRDCKTTDSYRLGEWVRSQRQLKDTMPLERRRKLEALPDWVWDTKEDAWQIGFQYLKDFSDCEGHCNVPRNYKTDDGYLLGAWLGNQRIRRDELPEERKSKLEALQGWAWNVKDTAWDTWFGYLKEFVAREGHCTIAAKYQTAEGHRLGLWVSNQRAIKDEMPPERKARLESLPGWVWDAITEQWETGFRHLQEFANREGHCRVAGTYRANDGYRLGVWVGGQRYKKDSLPAEQKARLEALPGWVWDYNAERWETGFRYLQEFANREGHCQVPNSYKTTDGYRLDQWMKVQRTTKGMSAERKERLEAVPGWFWRVRGNEDD